MNVTSRCYGENIIKLMHKRVFKVVPGTPRKKLVSCLVPLLDIFKLDNVYTHMINF